ncbi:MAG: 4-hydroxy-tetrahydrodipicolinate reductase [Rikenellaceae bacterium]
MKVAIIGYGKMGRAIEQILISRSHEVALIIDVDNQGDLTSENLAKVDVAIEFSAPSAAFSNIEKCLASGTPVVCGTTAWLDRYDLAVELCEQNKGAFFYASNYSVGVNLTFKINAMLARMMNRFSEYDVTLNEVHHTQKLDAPSGTAITMAEGIVENLDRLDSWQLGTTTEASLLEVTAQRRSMVPGTHTVVWESAIDKITLEHEAKGREGFALGAVLAAEFLCGKSGVYTMDDLMNQ